MTRARQSIVRRARAAPAIRAIPARAPFAVQFDMSSKISGRDYRIYVNRPDGPAPEGGWPVIYVLDGDTQFSTVASQNLLRSSFRKEGVLVVGIGYPNAAARSTLRNRDYTPSEPVAHLPGMGQHGKAPPTNYGGADNFHRFMMQDLRPAIAATYPINAANQTLMGHSFGGLFALHVLFKHPETYRTFIVGSPSIWWNDGEVLKAEPGFVAAVQAGRVAPRVLVTIAEYEQDPDRHDLAGSGPREELAGRLAEIRMVDRARDLGARLSAVRGIPDYRARFVLLPDETHITVIPATLSRGLGFSLEP